jgi:hypothetical protein
MADEQESSTENTEAESATDTGQHDDATAHLSDAGKKALSEERKARSAAERSARAAQKQLDDMAKRLKEFEDRDKSEAEKLAERAAAAEKQAESATARLLRFEVAAAKKLPPGFAARLQGSTKEELEADAEALLKDLGEQQQRTTPSYDGGVRQTAKTTDMNALIRQTAGRG